MMAPWVILIGQLWHLRSSSMVNRGTLSRPHWTPMTPVARHILSSSHCTLRSAVGSLCVSSSTTDREPIQQLSCHSPKPPAVSVSLLSASLSYPWEGTTALLMSASSILNTPCLSSLHFPTVLPLFSFLFSALFLISSVYQSGKGHLCPGAM